MCCFLCFLLFFVPGNSSWLSFCAPTSMVLDIVECQGRGGVPKWPKFNMAWNRTSLNMPRIPFYKFADPSNWGRSLPEGNKDHLLSEARSELMKQEHQVRSVNNCIGELQQQAYAQRLEVQDAPHGDVESRRTSSSTRRIIYEGNGSPRHSDPKYARIGRNEENSRTTSWRSLSAKIERKIMRQYKSSLLSCRKIKIRWILWMIQENFMGDCLTFPVNLQWFQVLVPCWAATNACLLTHGIQWITRKRVWWYHCGGHDYMRNSLINLKTIAVSNKIYKNYCDGTY